MNPEDKAFEILEHYLTIFEIFGVRTMFNKNGYNKAVDCAIIDVKNTISVLERIKATTTDLKTGLDINIRYWNDVKESLEKK